jgi:catechol 2,3-dioxygenase-like lactoylglutathione lyase family enzyme
MTSYRTGDPWRQPATYARGLRGLTVNLLVRSIERARAFQLDVLGADEVYADPDIGVYRYREAEWMLHADHTYDDHPLSATLRDTPIRGIGAELRLHGRDPDLAEAAARRLEYVVLQGAMDKPHGLRECYLIDPDGYLWVPDRPIEP